MHGVSQETQPCVTSVGELELITEVLGPDRSQEQDVQGVGLLMPERVGPFLLGVSQRRVTPRVGTGQAEFPRCVRAHQPPERLLAQRARIMTTRDCG